MKTDNWVIIFIIIIFSLLIPYFYKTALIDKEQYESVVIKDDTISACRAAINEVYSQDGLTFETIEARKVALDTFYHTLGKSLNYDEAELEESLKYHIPCVIMVDWNGYYVQYVTEYKDVNNYTQYSEQITNINTWNNTYGNYIVRYRLDNTVEVRMVNADKKEEGNYSKVYEALGKPAELSFMETVDAFNLERNNCVVQSISETSNYYINTHNSFFNTHEASYAVSLPCDDNNGTDSLLNKPSVIAFYQGAQVSSLDGYVNVYTYVASDLSEGRLYFVQEESDGSLYYHESGCSHLTNFSFYGSMTECAKKGANPDTCVR